MTTLLRVFQYEFRRNVRRKGYLFVSIGIPIIAVVIFYAIQIYGQVSQNASNQSAVTQQKNDDLPIRPVGLIDYSGLLQRPDVATGLIPFENEQAAQAAMHTSTIGSYYVVATDYLKSGQIDLYIERMNLSNLNSGPLEALIRASLIAKSGRSIDPRIVARLSSRLVVVSHKLNGSADGNNTSQANFNTGPGEGASFILVYLFAMILFFSAFTTSGYLMQSVVEEKETRMMEVLMSSMRPIDLLGGKILAMGILGLIQMVLWAATAVFIIEQLVSGLPAIPITPEMLGLKITAGQLIVLGTYFLLTYLLLSSFYAGIGAISNNMREGPQYAVVITLPMIAPLWATSIIAVVPDGPLAVVMSLFPLTAPLSMVMRISITDVPLVQILISIVLLAITVCITIWVAARLFRVNTLLSGQVPKLSQIPRLIRESM